MFKSVFKVLKIFKLLNVILSLNNPRTETKRGMEETYIHTFFFFFLFFLNTKILSSG